MVFGPFLDLLRQRSGTAGPEASTNADAFTSDASDDALYGIEPLRILISPLVGDIQGLVAGNTFAPP